MSNNIITNLLLNNLLFIYNIFTINLNKENSFSYYNNHNYDSN